MQLPGMFFPFLKSDLVVKTQTLTLKLFFSERQI